MANKKTFGGMLALTLAFGLAVIACPNDTTAPDTGTEETIDWPVSIEKLFALIKDRQTNTTIKVAGDSTSYWYRNNEFGTYDKTEPYAWHGNPSIKIEDAVELCSWVFVTDRKWLSDNKTLSLIKDLDAVFTEEHKVQNETGWNSTSLANDATVYAWYYLDISGSSTSYGSSTKEGHPPCMVYFYDTDTEKTIHGCAYSFMDQGTGSVTSKHYLLTGNYEDALAALKTLWNKDSNATYPPFNSTSAIAKKDGTVFLEVNDSISDSSYDAWHDYRLAVWDTTTNQWKTAVWSKQAGMTEPPETETTIGGMSYSQKEENIWKWDVKNYRLTISYDEALSKLVSLWGDAPAENWYSLLRSTSVSEQAYRDKKVVFEETLDDYRLLRVVDGQWRGVGWRKQ
jgi:hypothetical protein